MGNQTNANSHYNSQWAPCPALSKIKHDGSLIKRSHRDTYHCICDASDWAPHFLLDSFSWDDAFYKQIVS